MKTVFGFFVGVFLVVFLASKESPNAYSIEVPPGVIIYSASPNVKPGYLAAQGQAVSRTTYADLFAEVGTTFGVGDGSTTFNLPNGQGRFALGKAVSGTGSTIGATGGNIDHVHSVDPPNTATGTPSATSGQLVGVINVASATHTHNLDISSFNSTAENPPYIALNCMIKY